MMASHFLSNSSAVMLRSSPYLSSKNRISAVSSFSFAQGQTDPAYEYQTEPVYRNYLFPYILRYEGFLGENTRLRELRRRGDFGRFWAFSSNFGLLGAVFA